ncbi:MAG TPA: hypothetical protein VF748_17790, partial [Candidatus Acidoferrum sp.]
RHAAYDLKKLRGKHIVCRIGQTRRYKPLASGLRALTALLVLRNKAINLNPAVDSRRSVSFRPDLQP